MIRSPEADDPNLQERIDELIENPEAYYIETQMRLIKQSIEYNERMIRALSKEVDRSKRTYAAFFDLLEKRRKK